MKHYSLDKARDLLDEAYDNGFKQGHAQGRAQAIDGLRAEKPCADEGWHDAHIWHHRARGYWCPGKSNINVQF